MDLFEGIEFQGSVIYASVNYFPTLVGKHLDELSVVILLF